MKDKKDISIEVSPKNPDSKWVTIDSNNKIISEGKTPEKTVEEAKKVSDDFFLMFVPQEGHSYIF